MSNAKARQSVTSQIRRVVVDVVRSLQVPQVVYATVTAVTGTTVSIKQQGTTTTTTGVHHLAAYSPTVNDVVVCVNVSGDLWVVGKFA